MRNAEPAISTPTKLILMPEYQKARRFRQHRHRAQHQGHFDSQLAEIETRAAMMGVIASLLVMLGLFLMLLRLAQRTSPTKNQN